jgi:hypothetical protein
MGDGGKCDADACDSENRAARHFLRLLELQDVDDAVAVTSHESSFVGGDGTAQQRSLDPEGRQFGPGFHSPYLDRFVVRRRSRTPSFAVHCYAIDVVGVAFQSSEVAPVRDIPHLQCSVGGGGERQAPVLSYGHATDIIRVASQGVQFEPAFDVPHLQRRVKEAETARRPSPLNATPRT